MHMKRPYLGLLGAAVALTSCQTAHNAAVSTFRVIDAPHQYIRHELHMDEEGNQVPADSTTTTTTATQTNAPGSNNQVPPQSYQQAPPPPSQRQVVVNNPPPPPEQHQVVTSEHTRESEPPPATPTPAPRVTSRSTTNLSSTSHEPAAETKTTTTHTGATTSGNLPYAKPVPGKPGYVFSPYDKNGGYVDVTGFAPGSKVKDPYSGKVFLVP